MKTRHVGRDRVELDGDRLTIITPVGDMRGWDVRRYRASVIRFDGRTWRITARTPNPDKTTRFELEPWQPHDGELPGPAIEYSAEFVALRDHTEQVGRRRSRVTGLLGWIRPLTGFLPARTKDRLETVYGIDPVASTKASVFIEFLIALNLFVWASIATVAGGFGADIGVRVNIVLPIGLIVLLDAVIRWSRVLEEDRPPPGFYEWLWRRK